MYGTAYPFYFRSLTRSEMMKRFVKSKIVSKVNDSASAYFVLNKITKIF